jgi:hypothetical protein
MRKNGAGAPGVLVALTCALAMACGSSDDGATGADDEQDQLTSADVSDAEASALEDSLCAGFRDDSELAPTSITIRNDRASPIYLEREPTPDDCRAPALFALTQGGLRLSVHGSSACTLPSCERLQDEGERALDCDGCDDSGRLVRLEPGATLDAGKLDAEYVAHGTSESTWRMPARCAARAAPGANDGVACVSKRALAAGAYRLRARAFDSLECDGRRGCECGRSTEGWCVLDRRHLRHGRVLEAALELELPSEHATLVFGDP